MRFLSFDVCFILALIALAISQDVSKYQTSFSSRFYF